MSKKHAAIEGIEWREGDVRCMDAIPSNSIDVAFDKGTLDAMIHGSPWNPPDDVLENSSQYIREVYTSVPTDVRVVANRIQVFRVLKPDGMFLYITYRQPHFMKPLLELEQEDISWDIKVDELGGLGTFGYYGFTLTKAAA